MRQWLNLPLYMGVQISLQQGGVEGNMHILQDLMACWNE
jgi:hypothetical protein